MPMAVTPDVEDAIVMLPQLDLRLLTENVFSLENYEDAWEGCRSRRYLKALLAVDPSLNELVKPVISPDVSQG